MYWYVVATRTIPMRCSAIFTEISRAVIAEDEGEAVLKFHNALGVYPDAFDDWSFMVCRVSRHLYEKAKNNYC